MMTGDEISKIIDHYIDMNESDDQWSTLFELFNGSQLSESECDLICYIVSTASERTNNG